MSPNKARRPKPAIKNGRVRPRSTRRNSQSSTLASLEALLRRQMLITISGEARKVTAGDAIVMQLVQKAFAGDADAEKTLLQFLHFAGKRSNRPAALLFPENEYTCTSRKSAQGESDE